MWGVWPLPCPEGRGLVWSARGAREADRRAARVGGRGAPGPARAAQPAGADPRRRRGRRERGRRRRRLRALRRRPRRVRAARRRALLRGVRRRARAGHVLPHRLPRPELRPRRLARAGPRPAPGAARRLLPPLRALRLARAGADAGAARRGRARGGSPPAAARGARDWRHRPGTRTGEAPVLINDMPRYEILDEFALQELERGWRRIVSDLGIEFLYEEALDVFKVAGQDVEGELVKFDPDWILEQVAKAPSRFELQARNPERSVQIGGNAMVFSAVYGCPFVREGLERRDATYDDFQNLVKLAQSFPQLDSPGGTICEPNDLPLDSRHLDMVYALTTLSDKVFMGSVTSGPNARDTIAMAEMIFGRESLEKTPAVISLINVNSPLRYDDRMLSALVEYAKAGQATVVTPFLLMGAMSPVSVAATLAQQVAEALAGIALVQTIRPGCPVVFGSFLSNTDMQSGSPSFGTPESAVGLFCTGQIARHYNLPFRGGGALTSSQVVDVQAGYESMMSLWPTFLAGTNFVMHSAGWLESALVSCYEKFVTDVETLRMLHEVFKPLEINEETLAYSAHQEVGQGGHFLGAAHTLERFRECFYRPLVSSTENYERWNRNGGRDTATRATDIWRKTLDEYEQPPIEPDLQAELKAYVDRRRTELGD
ncbi:MAG: trimethylamine methyltransferase family protein [Acidobacteriota bacterium]|nr:trimethylamine methyltransferase family protein [Acidobacteriota bacterium]